MRGIETKQLTQDRFRTIEVLALWEGEVSNRRLRELFLIHPTHISRLISDYRKQFRSYLMPAKGRGNYVAGPRLTPTLSLGRIEDYLELLEPVHAGPVELLRPDVTSCEPELFSVLLRASRAGTGVSITYLSLSRPQGSDRIIFPHALVSVGRRWHVRAWDSDRQEFRDFNLGRVKTFKSIDTECPESPEEDTGWNTFIDVAFTAHNLLTPDQARVIEHEMFRRTVGLRITVRGCLVHYLIQEMAAAIVPSEQRPPAYQIQVENIDEVRPWLITNS